MTDLTFSQRTGIKPSKNPFQLESMNRQLKTGLWNAVLKYYLCHTGYLCDEPSKDQLFKKVYADLYNEPVDEMPEVFSQLKSELKANILERLEWNEVYDLIEFLPNNYVESSAYYDTNPMFIEYCNDVLVRENAAYRFINKRIAEITSEEEIKEVEAAIASSIDPVKTHLENALELMSDRENPNYRNSIKESVSAVEYLCTNISGKPNITFAEALKEIVKQNKITLAPPLKIALEKIYGYTSSSDGIRHALQEGSYNLTQDEARFMLIACSAFVNYLRSKSSAAAMTLDS